MACNSMELCNRRESTRNYHQRDCSTVEKRVSSHYHYTPAHDYEAKAACTCVPRNLNCHSHRIVMDVSWYVLFFL